MNRLRDIIDVSGEPKPVAYLPLDEARHTIALMEHSFAAQARQQGYAPALAATLGRLGALEMYAAGWRSSTSIMHRADNPIPAPTPPHVPSPLRLAA